MVDRDTLVRILDLARWAPSGDNTQPWRFEIVDEGLLAVHGFDTRDHVVYDVGGNASHIAHGALLETLRIAATGFGCLASWTLRPGCSDSGPIYDVKISTADSVSVDPLFPFIEKRVVQRRPMRTTALTDLQRQTLAAAPGAGYEVRFFESVGERVSIAKLLWDNAYIRLTCPEAFEVHREVIEWGVRYSKDRIPEQAVGVDPLTGKLMRWVMHSWGRVDFFNKYLFGTIAPRIQLDLLPAIGCAAHFVLVSHEPLELLTDFVRAGTAMQRFWLTATSLGLQLQPEMTPLIFAWYVHRQTRFSQTEQLWPAANAVAARLQSLLGGGGVPHWAFMGRVGSGPSVTSRSIRLDFDELVL